MIDIGKWMDEFVNALDENFGERVWFVGLQGSYARNEATETSDIDVVVILDELSYQDIYAYDAMLNEMPCRELICGFLSGKDEIFNWEPSDLFQFCNDTIPVRGSLDEVYGVITDEDVDRAIKTGACNIYHGCVHNMLHEKSDDVLRGLYKAASFVVQAVCFKNTGQYIRHMPEMYDVADEDEKKIVKTFMDLKNGGEVDFDNMSGKLYLWSKTIINENE